MMLLLLATSGQTATFRDQDGAIPRPEIRPFDFQPAAPGAGAGAGFGTGDLSGQLDGFDIDKPFFDSDGNPVGRRGFRTFGDEIRDLGDLPGGPAEAVAHGSNRQGLIVGESMVEGGRRAFLWRDGRGMTDLGDLPGGDISSVARSINEAGQVVGQASSDAGLRAFLWDADRGMVDLNDLVETPEGVVLRDATGIDNSGRIIGMATIAPEVASGNDDADPAGEDLREVPFVWDPEGSRLDLFGALKDIERSQSDAPPEAGETVARDADAEEDAPLRFAAALGLVTDGPVVGRALDAAGLMRPVLWLPEADLLGLSALPGGDGSGTAHAVNAAGRVVGQSLGADGRPHAFLWDAERGMVDLGGLLVDADGAPLDEAKGITLLAAVDIIDDGRILAWGMQDEVIHFYRLTPAEPKPVEPAIRPDPDTPDVQPGTAGEGMARLIRASLDVETGDAPEGQGGYTLTVIGQLVLGADPAPVLSMDESGRVVGGCDLLALDCPYLWSNLEQVTNFVPETLPEGDPPFGPFGGSFAEGIGTVSTAGQGTSGRAIGAPNPINAASRARGVSNLPANLFSGLLPGGSTDTGTTGPGNTGNPGTGNTGTPPPPAPPPVVPLPPAAAVLVLGLLCLFGFRRRDRATA